VGGGMLLHGLAEFGIEGPERAIAVVENTLKTSGLLGAILSWLVSASAAALAGIAAGFFTEAVLRLGLAVFRGST
jgi:uncharacterized protein